MTGGEDKAGFVAGLCALLDEHGGGRYSGLYRPQLRYERDGSREWVVDDRLGSRCEVTADSLTAILRDVVRAGML